MLKADHKNWIEKIDAALEEIRPHLKVDGGNIEVVEVTEDMTVKIKWLGNCEFCSMSAMTMKAGVEQTLKAKIPEIQSIEAVNGIS
ncbi:MAG: NifU family protein [Saprospiraceae bacterium]|nr:NifU family protein [Saprospiraceae bacterium]